MMTMTRPIFRRNSPAQDDGRGGAPWLGVWWLAQITPMLFSTWVALVTMQIAPLVAVASAACAALLVACRNTRIGLWWRFGVRPATEDEQTRILAAIVPVASLRGRNQPARVWIGQRRAGRLVASPNRADLVIGTEVLKLIERQALTDVQVSALVVHGVGQRPVLNSRMVIAVEAYTAAWQLLRLIATGVVQRLRLVPLFSFAWKVRWVTFAVAVWQSYTAGRWIVAVGVAVLAVLTWSTGYLERRWQDRLATLGDRHVINAGLGDTLADLLDSRPETSTQRLRGLRGTR